MAKATGKATNDKDTALSPADKEKLQADKQEKQEEKEAEKARSKAEADAKPEATAYEDGGKRVAGKIRLRLLTRRGYLPAGARIYVEEKIGLQMIKDKTAVEVN